MNILTPEQEAASPTTSPERLWELAYQTEALAFLVVQNHHAPSELLQVLANICGRAKKYVARDGKWKDWYTPNPQFNPDIGQAITANPNTPLETLLELGEDFPQEMLDNPMFDLLLLENPNLVEEIPINTIRSLLTLEIIPLFLKRGISRHKESWQIAKDPNTPNSILEILAQDADSNVCRIAKN